MSDRSFIRPARIPGKRMVLTKGMIEESQKHTKSNMEASRWLGVNYNTYKKWAKYYGVFEQHLNQSGVGVKKGWASYKINLDDILNGKRESKYSNSMLKKRLIEEGYLQEECGVCGWNEKRLVDDKICLSIDFLDSNSNNVTLENLRILCSNCYFTNVGNFKNSKHFCK